MKKKVKNDKRRKWLARRTRTRISLGSSERVTLTVFRSEKHIYAQLIEPGSGRTLGSVSTRSKEIIGDSTGGNIEAAKRVGTAVATLAKEKSIDKVVFNRNGFLFHGRVKALADAAREAGLEF